MMAQEEIAEKSLFKQCFPNSGDTEFFKKSILFTFQSLCQVMIASFFRVVSLLFSPILAT